MGETIESRTLCFLITGEGGDVLSETGLNPAMADDPEDQLGTELAERCRPVPVVSGEVVERLNEFAVASDDIDDVVGISCVCWDHAGGLKTFKVAMSLRSTHEEWKRAAATAPQDRPLFRPRGRGRRRSSKSAGIVAEPAVDFHPRTRGLSCRRTSPRRHACRLLGPRRSSATRIARVTCRPSPERASFVRTRGTTTSSATGRSSFCARRAMHAVRQALLVWLLESGSLLLLGGVIRQAHNHINAIITARLVVSPDEPVVRNERASRNSRPASARPASWHHDSHAWATMRQAPKCFR
jgi:hypothetical protein